MPDIESSIWKKYKGKGVEVIGLYSTKEVPTDLAAFIKQNGITFRTVKDVNDTLHKVRFPLGVKAPYPREIIVDKKLTIRAVRSGFKVKEMDSLIQKLLKE